MDESEKKAVDLISQAEKKLKSSSGFLGSLMRLETFGTLKINDLSNYFFIDYFFKPTQVVA